MKRSRLRMFKATSMTISVMGVLLIVATIIILAYMGFTSLSSFISTDASTSNANDELAALKTEYATLESEYNKVKVQVQATDNNKLKTAYTTAELELVKTKSAITDVESAISVGKPSDEVLGRLEVAKAQLEKAKSSLASVRSQV